MTIEHLLEIIETALHPNELTPVQDLVLRQVWEGKTYAEIADNAGYNSDYIKSVGSQLWQLLSEAFGEPVTKRNFRSVIKGRVAQMQTSQKTRFQAVSVPSANLQFPHRQDWGEAIDTSYFCGRTQELAVLEKWIVQDRCRLVSVLGMGGVGKTALTVHCGELVQGEFKYLIWRNLRNAPPFEQLLTDLLEFLSQGEEIDFPKDSSSRLSCLMNYLRQHRCLLMLDNYESILDNNQEPAGDSERGAIASPTPLCSGRYRQGYQGYGQLLRRVAEERHQSCLLLTSREKPIGLASKEGDFLPVRALQLKGLEFAEGKQLLQSTGLSISDAASQQLIERYSGNPLALKSVATCVRELFNREIDLFLDQRSFIFGEIANLLDQQFSRLSILEQQVMYGITIHGGSASLEQLQHYLQTTIHLRQLLEVLKNLQWRSLIESSGEIVTLRPLVQEYVSQKLLDLLNPESDATNPFHPLALQEYDGNNYLGEHQLDCVL